MQDTTTTCQADAKWLNEDDIVCKQPNYVVTLERSTGDGDTWAAGYTGNLYTGTISTTVFGRFGWVIDDKTVEYYISIKGIDVSCEPVSKKSFCDQGVCVTCDVGGNVVSRLSIDKELNESNHSIAFYTYEGDDCGYKNKNYNLHVQSNISFCILSLKQF